MTRDPVFEVPDKTIINIGCALGYQAFRPVQALFLVQPHIEPGYSILEESMEINTGALMERYIDLYGNPALKTMLMPGYNEFHYEATLELQQSDFCVLPAFGASTHDLSKEVVRYTLPSRYCESDKLYGFAQDRFGHLPHGFAQVQAICDWVHHHLEYRYGSGDSTLSACEAIVRGYGVCRDFAHVMIALCRALDLPARYVAGHIPKVKGNEIEGDHDIGVDFHAYTEVYFDKCWHTFDARYNRRLNGKIKIAHGMDAVDAAFATFYGNVAVVKFKAWSRQAETFGDVPIPLKGSVSGQNICAA
jgi:transglutaminase-like putative cysteine protease